MNFDIVLLKTARIDAMSLAFFLVVLGLTPILQSRACINVYPVGVANNSIIPNNQMSASTSFYESVDYLTPKYGRLWSKRAWCANGKRSGDWLQIDMGGLYFICGVATQGKKYRVVEYTTNYTLSMSRDGITWQQYQEDGDIKYFEGNHDDSTIVHHNLTNPLWTQYVRFYIVTFQVFPCFRVELFVELTPPVIKIPPQQSTIALGTNLRLDCLAKGSPFPKITWKLNGNDVVFGKQLENGSLLVEKVENDDSFEGVYRCIAENRVGRTFSDAQVSIYEKPKILNSSPPSKSFFLGATAVLSCYATGDPHPTITWTKDGSTHTSRGTPHDHGHVLVITNISSRDQGVYRCEARNTIGQASTLTNVTVIDLPAIDTLLTRQVIRTGIQQTVNIGCYGNSLLPLTYKWSRNKVAITSSNYDNSPAKVFGNVLVVTPRDKRDYGKYTCHVDNQVGRTDVEIELQPFDLRMNYTEPLLPKNHQRGSLQHLRCTDDKLGVIIPLVLALTLSIAINIRFIYHSHLLKKHSRPKTNSNSKSIPMSSITRQESHLIKDTEIAWDNLLPETSGGPYVNAGVVSDKEILLRRHKNDLQT